MALENIKGLSQDQQFEEAAKYAGVPASVLRGMWRVESDEGKNMKSGAGAEGHFQIMPGTRSTWEKREGRKLDPYDFADGITLAALTLKENLQAAGGDIDTALKMYNGGWDRKNWNNPETQAYAGKVLGNVEANTSNVSAPMQPTAVDVDAAWDGDSVSTSGRGPGKTSALKAQLSDVEKGLIDNASQQAVIQAVLQGKDPTAAGTEVREVATTNAQALPDAATRVFGQEVIDNADRTIAEKELNKQVNASVTEEARRQQTDTFGDRFGAAFDSNITAAVLRTMENTQFEKTSRPMTEWYLSNIDKIEEFNDTEEDRTQLRGAQSMEEVEQMRKRIREKRTANQILADAGPVAGTLWSIAGTVADPVGFAATYGVGKVAQVAKVGGAGFFAEGQIAKGILATGVEGMATNVLTDATLTALGEHRSGADFVNDAGAGLLFGTMFSIPGARGARRVQMANAFIADSTERNAALAAAAQVEAGAGASPTQIKSIMDRMEFDADKNWLTHVLGDTVDTDRLMARPDVGAERPAAPTPEPVPGQYVATVKGGEEFIIKTTRETIGGKEAITLEVVGPDGLTLKDSLGRDVGRTIASPDGGNLSSNVSPEYQRRGIATALNKVAKLEGADIGDSAGNFRDGTVSTRTDAGQAFRKGADIDKAEVRPMTKAAKLSPYPVNTLLDTKKKRAKLVEKYDLKSRISDDAERIQVSEVIARAERIIASNGIDAERLKTILSKVDLEATSTTLLSDKSPVSKAVAIMLMEHPEGAAGRKRTASLSRDIQLQQYLGNTGIEYAHFYDQWRTNKGVSPIRDFLTNNAERKRFDRAVAIEADARYQGKPATTTDPFVLRAMDSLDKSYDQMRLHQRTVGVVGFERLPEQAVRGYLPRRWDLRAISQLSSSPIKRNAFLKALQNEFEVTAGFSAGDDEFTRALSVKYLERLEQRASGGMDVPANLYSTDTADILRDSLRALSLNEEEVQKVMGRYSRGGASHTKSRIDMNMTQQYADGEGGTMMLLDYLDNNHLTNHRQYAGRVAGDVALAKYGVMGNAGALELRKAMAVSGASPRALAAYDQFIAEMRGQPFGQADHKWLVNARVLTGATRLGGALFPQLGTYADSIAAVGIEGAMKAIGGIPRLHAEIRAKLRGEKIENGILDGLETLGMDYGMTDYRLVGLYDVDEHVTLYGRENVTTVDRAIRSSGNAVRIMSGHRAITAVQTRGMAEQIVQKAWKFIRDGGEDKALDDMGINLALRERLHKQMKKVVEFDAEGNVKVFDPRKADPEFAADMVVFRDSVHRGASQIVQREFAGEVGKWAHNGLLKTLLQFRTFSLIAQQKQLGRMVGVHGYGKAGLYIMGAASFAVPIHAARMMIRASLLPEQEREEFLAENLAPDVLGRATMNYVAGLGLLPDALDVSGGMASGWVESFGVELPSALKPTGGRTFADKDLIGGTLAPSVGVINDLGKGISGDKSKLIRSLPGANLPYIQPAWLGLEAELKE